jgi:hypothetical protein
LSNLLKSNGYTSCQNENFNISFGINLCGSVLNKDMNMILTVLKTSWQSLYSSDGGLGSNNLLRIIFQNKFEFIPNDNM